MFRLATEGVTGWRLMQNDEETEKSLKGLRLPSGGYGRTRKCGVKQAIMETQAKGPVCIDPQQVDCRWATRTLSSFKAANGEYTHRGLL